MKLHEIAHNPDYLGLTTLSKPERIITDLNKDLPVIEPKFDYNCDFNRIIQGKLGNGWFLSALSLVATESTLFKGIFCDGDFDQYH